MALLLSLVAEALRDRYVLERELGRGGMATVYLAHDLKHDRPVALKVLRPELSVSLGGERFQREIALATRLQHPHILPVYDSGVIDATPSVHWFTMPYVTGRSLRDRLSRERQLPVDEAVRIAHETARALDHAHRHGIIHRDIKPANLLLTEEGDTLVADFGVGRIMDPKPGERLTEQGLVLGTPQYMSPEQAAGDPALDGRTDVYSLGVVLYEMLAGEPPFTGPSPQSIAARRLTEQPRPLRLARETVPPALEHLVMRALARSPADRFTAGELAEALDTARRTPAATETVVLPAAGRRLPWRPIAAIAAVAFLAAGWLALHRSEPSPSLDPSLVAVAPFHVLDPRLELWREGLVDLLARNLDGAGPLRSVAPTVVIRRWNGRADAQSAGSLGRATGAGLTLFGSVIPSGPDSVKVRATLLDVARGRPVDEWEVAEEADRIDRLTDTLTFRLLRSVGQTRPVSAVRLAGFGSTSLPALKLFLQGEQFLRRSEFDSALGHYERAIQVDSTFPLALRRASAAMGWMRTGTDSLSVAYALRAGSHNRGLAPRESLLVATDSLMASLLQAGPLAQAADSGWAGRLTRLFATVDAARTRYRSDPEVWFAAGEALAHFGPYAGRTLEEEVEAFDHAIALDSAFAPAYIHPIEVVAREGPAAVLRYLKPYLALDPHDAYADGLRLIRRLLDSAPTPGTPPEIRYAGVTDNGLFAANNALSRLPDSAEVGVDLARFYATRPRQLPGQDPAENAVRPLRRALLTRGHMREGYLAPGRLAFTVREEAALLGGVPAESAAVEYARRLRGPLAAALGPALPWWAQHGDTVSLRAVRARAQRLTARDAPERDQALARYLWQASTAYLTLVRGDTAGAIDRLAALHPLDCVRCYLDRLVLARLLVDAGDDERAWAILRVPPPTATLAAFPGEVFWALLGARVAERRGDREYAVWGYGWVAGMWRNADPELQPYVAEARAALQRLTEER